MGHMGICQKYAIVSDNGFTLIACRARIHGHAFADGAIFANIERCFLAVIFQILRLVPKGGEWENARFCTNCGNAGDHCMGKEL